MKKNRDKNRDINREFHSACYNNDTAEMELLIANGADINSISSELNNAYHYACMGKALNAFKKLVKLNVHGINNKNKKNLLPVDYAVIENAVDIIEFARDNAIFDNTIIEKRLPYYASQRPGVIPYFITAETNLSCINFENNMPTLMNLNTDNQIIKVIHKKYPISLDFEYNSTEILASSLLLQHACGIDHINESSVSYEHELKTLAPKFDKLLTVTDEAGNITGKRTIKDAASHANDMLRSMVKNIMFNRIVTEHPNLTNNYYSKDFEYLEKNIALSLGQSMFGAMNINGKSYGQYGVDKILLLTERWDRGRNYINDKIFSGTDGSVLKWDALTDSVRAPNGLYLVPLVNKAELDNEGKKLSHCVAGVHSSCMNGSMHVIAVRYKPDTPAYTAGLSYDSKTQRFSEQSKPLGYKNQYPPNDIADAWKWYLTAVCHGHLQPSPERLETMEINASKREINNNQISTYIGYNPVGKDGEAKAEEIWQAWRKVFDTDRFRYRKSKTVNDFIYDSGVDNVIKAVSVGKQQHEEYRHLLRL